ncbi:MAG TPA: sigma-70 family RNA polymerase sigma factor, partial [bacterium]|nr:sigma-70 family RNA polymerase sigma factor [bacterium]
FTTWVYTFVRNHCFDVMKKRRLKTTSMNNVGTDATDREFADARELQPTTDLENSELGRRIGEALSTLGEDQRMVFVLREYEQLDYREIATITGVNEGTVKSRLFRAKESLRKQLAPYLEAGA